MSQNNTFNSSGETKDNSHVFSIRSVTAKQLSNAHELKADGPTCVDGAPLGKFRLVGVIRSIKNAGSATVFEVEDVSGKISVRRYNNNTEESDSQVLIGTYAVLYGTARVYNDNRTFNVDKIVQPCPIDFVLYHEMAALREHLDYKGTYPMGRNAATTTTDAGSSEGLFVGNEMYLDKVIQSLPADEPGLSAAQIARALQIDELAVSDILHNLEMDSRAIQVGVGIYVKAE